MATIEQELGHTTSIGILFHYVAVVLRFDELLRDNQVVTGEDVECRELPFDSFPVGLVWLTTVLRGGRHQCFIAHLVANIVRFPTAIGTAELEFEDLLSRCFP